MITPSGCRHCGVPKSDHGLRWLKGPGMHQWAPPTETQILQRMKMRRRFKESGT